MSDDKLIFNPDNTGLWIHGSEKKKFTWRAGEVSNAISVSQKFPGNEKSDWILEFFKEECSKDVLNGFYETYTYNVGYIDNKSNGIIRLNRHTYGCSYVDYNGPSDWDNYNDSNANGENGDGENGGSNHENNSGNSQSGDSGDVEDFDEINFTSTSYTNKITVNFYFSDRVSSATIKYGTTPSCSSSKTASILAKSAYATITGLKPGTKYYFKCVAKSKSGKSCTTSEYPVMTLYN